MQDPKPGSDDAARLAFREIRAIMKKRGVGGTAFLVSEGRAFFVRELPKWAALRLEGEQIRVRIKSAELGKARAKEMAEATASFVCSMFDMAYQEAAIFANIRSMLERHWDIDHKPFTDFNPEADQ